MKWTDEEHNHLIELIREHGTKWKIVSQLMSERFKKRFGYEQVRVRYRMNSNKQESIEYKETTEIMADGSHKSDKLLKMSSEQLKDTAFLLKGHGYDPAKWEIVNAKSSIWNQHNKQDGTITLYSSKITVKPTVNGFDFDRLLAAIEKSKPVKPIKFVGYVPEEKTYLHLPLYDLHFGTSTIEYYENTLRSIVQLLEKSYTEVLIVIGQDLFHNDNFRGQTANGTLIDKVDMVKAYDDADLFYTTIIEKAIEKSSKVTVIYSKGNHDEAMSYGFARGFKKAYGQQVDFNIEFRERKAHMLGTNFLGLTHGDKNRKNIASNFALEFPEMWAKATTREVHLGHLHRKRATQQLIELISDEKGVIVREMGSGCATDQWHDDNGYTMAHKEFEIFEYTETKKKRIHYV